MIGDPLLADIHGKLEWNEKGAIELTPSNNRHALVQAFVTGQLQTLLPEGAVFTECSVETQIGVRVPDVAWASPGFMRRHGSTMPFRAAPELCVEVLSPSNTEAEMTEKPQSCSMPVRAGIEATRTFPLKHLNESESRRPIPCARRTVRIRDTSRAATIGASTAESTSYSQPDPWYDFRSCTLGADRLDDKAARGAVARA